MEFFIIAIISFLLGRKWDNKPLLTLDSLKEIWKKEDTTKTPTNVKKGD